MDGRVQAYDKEQISLANQPEEASLKATKLTPEREIIFANSCWNSEKVEEKVVSGIWY